MSRRLQRRRAFTLLETVLAAAFGTMVALAVLGLFLTLDRTDAMLAARYRQTAALERTHRVLSRAFLSLVTSDKPRPQPNRTSTTTTSGSTPAGGNRPATAGGPTPSGGRGAGAPSSFDQSRPEVPPPPPRLRLSADLEVAQRRMERPGTQRLSAGPVQVFEVVVHTSPVGRVMPGRMGVAAEMDRSEERTPGSGDGDKEDSKPKEPPRLLSPTGKVYRGAFVLRPTQDSANGGSAGDAPDSWTLWWKPLPPAREDGQAPGAAELAGAGRAVELATDIAYFHWQVFDDRERKPEYSAVWRTELPAYVEVELATTAGLWANWMFEVDWVDGSESDPQGAGDTETDAAGTGGDSTPPTSKIVPLKMP